MASDTSLIAEQGVATLPDAAWAQARQRAEIIGPLAALDVVGHEAADAAAHALGLSRRQVYVLIRRARQGAAQLPAYSAHLPPHMFYMPVLNDNKMHAKNA